MVNLLTDIGEEYIVETNVNGATITVGLYNDTTDTLGETSTLASISTEPGGAAYARQSDTVTTGQFSGDFGFDNDTQIQFDTTDSTQTVDAAFIVVNFTSDTVAGDGSPTDHLIAAGDLNQTRDLSQIDTLTIAAGDLTTTLN